MYIWCVLWRNYLTKTQYFGLIVVDYFISGRKISSMVSLIQKIICPSNRRMNSRLVVCRGSVHLLSTDHHCIQSQIICVVEWLSYSINISSKPCAVCLLYALSCLKIKTDKLLVSVSSQRDLFMRVSCWFNSSFRQSDEIYEINSP